MNRNPSSICPACDGSSIDKVDTFNRTYNLHQCQECKTVFILPRPSHNELENYYSEITVAPRKLPASKVIKYGKHVKKIIDLYRPGSNKVLDLGCSTGYLLAGLSYLGYTVAGTELSSTSIQRAKEFYNLDELYCSEFPPADLQNSFDVIVLSHVIEHVLSPGKYLQEASQYLREGGIIILFTPNIDSIGIKLFSKHYPVFCPPGHLNYFSRETLIQTAGHNFECIHSETGTPVFDERNTIFNLLIALTSKFKVKETLSDSFAPPKKHIDSVNAQARPSGYKHYVYSLVVLVTQIMGVIMFPFFAVFDRLGWGEHIEYIGRKK